MATKEDLMKLGLTQEQADKVYPARINLLHDLLSALHAGRNHFLENAESSKYHNYLISQDDLTGRVFPKIVDCILKLNSEYQVQAFVILMKSLLLAIPTRPIVNVLRWIEEVYETSERFEEKTQVDAINLDKDEILKRGFDLGSIKKLLKGDQLKFFDEGMKVLRALRFDERASYNLESTRKSFDDEGLKLLLSARIFAVPFQVYAFCNNGLSIRNALRILSPYQIKALAQGIEIDQALKFSTGTHIEALKLGMEVESIIKLNAIQVRALGIIIESFNGVIHLSDVTGDSARDVNIEFRARILDEALRFENEHQIKALKSMLSVLSDRYVYTVTQKGDLTNTHDFTRKAIEQALKISCKIEEDLLDKRFSSSLDPAASKAIEGKLEKYQWNAFKDGRITFSQALRLKSKLGLSALDLTYSEMSDSLKDTEIQKINFLFGNEDQIRAFRMPFVTLVTALQVSVPHQVVALQCVDSYDEESINKALLVTEETEAFIQQISVSTGAGFNEIQKKAFQKGFHKLDALEVNNEFQIQALEEGVHAIEALRVSSKKELDEAIKRHAVTLDIDIKDMALKVGFSEEQASKVEDLCQIIAKRWGLSAKEALRVKDIVQLKDAVDRKNYGGSDPKEESYIEKLVELYFTREQPRNLEPTPEELEEIERLVGHTNSSAVGAQKRKAGVEGKVSAHVQVPKKSKTLGNNSTSVGAQKRKVPEKAAETASGTDDDDKGQGGAALVQVSKKTKTAIPEIVIESDTDESEGEVEETSHAPSANTNEAPADSLETSEEQTEENSHSEDNPFLEKEVRILELFQEYGKKDFAEKPAEEEDEVPEDVGDIEYANDTYTSISIAKDVMPEVAPPSVAGILPQVSGILA